MHSANTTCDFYLYPNEPPAAAHAQAIPIRLNGDFSHGAKYPAPYFYTHKLLCCADSSISDSFPSSQRNLVCVPNAEGTPFAVVLVEKVNRFTSRVFLERLQPTWPTEEL